MLLQRRITFAGMFLHLKASAETEQTCDSPKPGNFRLRVAKHVFATRSVEGADYPSTTINSI